MQLHTRIPFNIVTIHFSVTDAKSIKEKKKNKENEGGYAEEEKMDDGTGRVFNKRTMRDQHGNYPVWMNRRRVVKHKKGRAKSQKATVKKDNRLTRKDKKKRTVKS